MKIQHNPQIIQAMQVYKKNQPGAVKKTSETPSVQDKIELSDKARDFQTALRAYHKLPEVREDRVAEVKEKVAQGKLATPDEVAERMLMNLNRESKF